VHETSPFRLVEEASGIFGEDELGNMTGIGADDKNGLWIIIKLFHDVPVLKVALFVEEEKKGDLAGCRGSKSCSLKHFENVLYVLAVDRKGCSEVVINGKGDVKLCDASFPPAHLLQQYEYECVDGGKTDVVELKMRGLSVPCCNISCGYYNAHKSEEYTNVLHLRKAYAFVRAWVEYTLETEKLG
jgi:putative aminopeptidase FrvX